jgi:hypothetical protein
MHFDRTVLVHASATEVARYLSDPRNVLSAWPLPLRLEVVHESPSEPGDRRYRLSSTVTRDTWIVTVRTLVADGRLGIEFGREGSPSQGRIQYDLEPRPDGTLLRSSGEFRMSRLLAAVNAVLGRHPDHPDPDTDARVQRWLAAHRDIPHELGDIRER